MARVVDFIIAVLSPGVIEAAYAHQVINRDNYAMPKRLW